MKKNQLVPLAILLSVILAGVLPTAGCGAGGGRRTEPVRGRVTFQSNPVPDAELVWTHMRPDAALSVKAVTDADGRFRVRLVEGDGLPPGRYNLVVRPLTPQAEIGAEVAPPTPVRHDIPSVYREPSTTPLEFEVGVGHNEFDVELAAPGR